MTEILATVAPPGMNYGAAAFWLDAAQLAFTVGLAIYVGIIAKTKINASRLESHEKHVDDRLDGVIARVGTLEERSTHMPTRADISSGNEKTHARIDAMLVQLGTIQGELKVYARTHELVIDHLIGKKA